MPHLITRDPNEFWTAGQWMTELTGGSDVGLSETIAKPEADSNEFSSLRAQVVHVGDRFADRAHARASGRQSAGWTRPRAFLSSKRRDEHGRPRNIEINRLKDKLGTRKVPTAELTLNGTPAQLVKGTTDGVRNIAPLLNITRLWNGISAVALMRRGLALASDYARKRVAFGAPLSEKPLHRDTLAGCRRKRKRRFISRSMSPS